MARGMVFGKVNWLSARGFTLFTQLDTGQFGKGLELYYKGCISVIKRPWKLQLLGLSYDKKSANEVMERQGVRVYLKRVK